MLDHCLPMGCLSSRSTTVSPIDSSLSSSNLATSSGKGKSRANQRNGYHSSTIGTKHLNGSQLRPKDNYSDSGTPGSPEIKQKRLVDIGTSFDNAEKQSMMNHSFTGGGDDIMSILMTERDAKSESDDVGLGAGGNRRRGGGGGGDKSNDVNNSNNNNNNNNTNSKDNNNDNADRASRMGYKMPEAADIMAPGGSNNSKSTARRRDETFDEDFDARQKEQANSLANLANDDQLEREGSGNNLPDGNTNSGDNSKNNNNNDAGVVALPNQNNGVTKGTNNGQGSQGNSFDEELNVDLLRQYIAVDYEISQLEDRDALRLYHEKIEQLEQLERELDMISFEAEEMAVRSETDLSQLDNRINSPNVIMSGRASSKGLDHLENNSILSGATGSMSPRSSIMRKQMQTSKGGAGGKNQKGVQQQQQQQKQNQIRRSDQENRSINSQQRQQQQQQQQQQQLERSRFSKENNLSYSTIEDVFNRKIILEKERDKLKKEVEMVIIECDRLQQRYKKRDEILDKLFDGRTGNGLENHLEQQLVWLMEQKHYVDQVFYAWKRAETLTSQTCEQFASALELLKRMPKVNDNEQRLDLAKSICNLLIKSRQDMEQAQRYNPNVDAPFFTDAETERFDRIIETLQSNSISQSEYNQMATVVQFAYKRAVSIRLWLEQILQITIARDSFELAEEYKWIAIQLRKERISLINAKLQEAPYQAMAKQVRAQLTQQQLQQQQQQQHPQLSHHQDQRSQANNRTTGQLAITDGKPVAGGSSGDSAGDKNRGQNEVNRDSGVESDDIDIEEDIYRLLEMNKGRLEAAIAASKKAGLPQVLALDATGRPMKSQPQTPAKLASGQSQLSRGAPGRPAGRPSDTSANSSSQRDQMMRERIQRRVEGERRLNSSVVPLASVLSSAEEEMRLLQEQDRQWRARSGTNGDDRDAKSSSTQRIGG